MGRQRMYQSNAERQRAYRQRRRYEKNTVTPYYQDDLVTLYCGDMRQVLPLLRPSVIITDPPYPREFLPLCGDLARIAAAVLPYGGRVLAVAGQSYLPGVLEQMGGHLTYQRVLPYLTPGGQSAHLWQRRVNSFWKPVLWYVKGAAQDMDPDSLEDDVIVSKRPDKRYHHWGQSESGMLALVQRVVRSGDLVVDPFAGGGATLWACKLLGVAAIGIDHDRAACERCVERFAQQVMCFAPPVRAGGVS